MEYNKEKLQEIHNEFNIKNGTDYWKLLIIEYILNNMEEDFKITEETLNEMAEDILNNDSMWQEIDYTIQDIVTKYKFLWKIETEEKTMEEKINEECIKRIKELKMHNNVVLDFEEGIINYSENMGGVFKGMLFWAKNREDILQAIQKFEESHKDSKVYHTILTRTEFGELLSILYVNGKEEENWENERFDLKNGNAFAYVENLSDNFLSEFGYIGIESTNGGLTRIF